RSEPVEVDAAEIATGKAGEVTPSRAVQGDVERARDVDRLEAEPVLDARDRVGGGHCGSAVSVARWPVFWKCPTCSCNLSKPYISESGVGGQPGTYTSTGTIRSTPF